MANGHGGPRPNSGRKSNAELASLRQLMDGAIDRETWKEVFQRVIEQIRTTGDANALYRLATLRFGIPTQAPNDENDVKPLNITDMRIYTTAQSSPPDAPSRALADDSDLASATNDNAESDTQPAPARIRTRRTVAIKPAPGAE